MEVGNNYSTVLKHINRLKLKISPQGKKPVILKIIFLTYPRKSVVKTLKMTPVMMLTIITSL